MQMKPTPENEKLNELLRESAAKVAAMTQEEREKMHEEQRKSWVRAEMAWPRDCPYR